MISYTHDDAWRASLNSCVEITAQSLKAFGIGDSKEIPAVIAAELQDKESALYRFIEVFYDEARFDAELSYAAESEGNKMLAHDDNARRKAVRSANLKRFNGILDDTLLFCRMSKNYGEDFMSAVRGILNDSFPHQGFLFELYETIMFKTRCLLIEEKGKDS